MDDFRDRFPLTAEVIDQGIAQGLHPGAQVYVSREGQTLANIGIGQARPALSAADGPGVPMTPHTILMWFSAGKPLAAVALAQLWEAGLLELDDPVSRHIPEFGVKGKQPITLRHLLTHTGGFRWADYLPTMSWDEIIARICNAPLEPRWIPGRTAGYHAFTSWFILGEVIRRVDPRHRPYDVYVRDEIFQPLGMEDCWLAMPPDRYQTYGDRIGILQPTGQGHVRPLQLDSQANSAICIPGASARGPVQFLGRFYEMLLNRGSIPQQSDTSSSGRNRILSAQSVEALTARHRTGLHDLTFKQTVDWGLGFIINSAIYGEERVPYGYGPHAGPRTFGHGGSQSSTAFADPDNRLVVALVFNGMPGEIAHHQRIRATLRAVYEDLRLM